jgi:hypothetical protein
MGLCASIGAYADVVEYVVETTVQDHLRGSFEPYSIL